MRRLLPSLLAVLALVLLPGAASAAIVPGQSIDGPSADIKSFGDVDLSPDGTGALVYVKAVGGFDHIFASRYLNGAWQAAEQVDTAVTQNIPSRFPRVAAGNGGRLVVTYLHGAGNGTVQSDIRETSASPWTHKTVQSLSVAQIAELEMDPVSGVAYAVYSDKFGGGGTDLYAARLTGTTWTDVGAQPAYNDANAKLDSDPTKAAGEDTQRGPRIAVDSAGNAFVAWTENPDPGKYTTWARKLTGTARGGAVQADLATIPGSDGSSETSDMVDIAVAGAGTSRITFRQLFKYGASNVPHAITRTFDGATYGTGDDVSGIPSGNVPGVEFPRIALNAGGQGLIGMARQDKNEPGENDVVGSALNGGSWSAGFRIDSIDNPDNVPTPVVAVGADGGGLWAWHETTAGKQEVRVRQRTAGTVLQAEAVVSNPTFGDAADIDLEASSDSAGHVAVGFSQGAAATKRIVAAVVDPIPGPGGGGGGGGGTDKTAPKLSLVKLSASVFRLGSLLPKFSAKRRVTPTGTTISFKVDEDSKTSLTFKRVKSGRRVGKRCLPATKARRRKPKCNRLVTAGRKLTYTTKKGSHKIRFQGRFSRKSKLAPGTYELTLVSTDSAKNASKPVRKRFTLKAALKRRR